MSWPWAAWIGRGRWHQASFELPVEVLWWFTSLPHWTWAPHWPWIDIPHGRFTEPKTFWQNVDCCVRLSRTKWRVFSVGLFYSRIHRESPKRSLLAQADPSIIPTDNSVLQTAEHNQDGEKWHHAHSDLIRLIKVRHLQIISPMETFFSKYSPFLQFLLFSWITLQELSWKFIPNDLKRHGDLIKLTMTGSGWVRF